MAIPETGRQGAPTGGQKPDSEARNGSTDRSTVWSGEAPASKFEAPSSHRWRGLFRCNANVSKDGVQRLRKVFVAVQHLHFLVSEALENCNFSIGYIARHCSQASVSFNRRDVGLLVGSGSRYLLLVRAQDNAH